MNAQVKAIVILTLLGWLGVLLALGVYAFINGVCK